MSTSNTPRDVTQRLAEAIRVNEAIDKLILEKLSASITYQQEIDPLCVRTKLCDAIQTMRTYQQETMDLCNNLPLELCLAIQKWKGNVYQNCNIIILIDGNFVFIAINGFDNIWRGLRVSLKITFELDCNKKTFELDYNRTSPVSFELSPTKEIVNLKTETWNEWIDTELRPHLKPLRLSLNELRRRPTWHELVNDNLPILISQLSNELITRHKKLEYEYIK